ncbi:MAG: hypothetical protein IPJ16_11605 [Bacteroidales bacterium]|nr:hypothetical protein [Bacteroidales bacterium]
MGYMPFLRYDPHYREFGAPVIDPIFNTLSIFFSVFYLQTFLNSKKKKYLLYIFSILILQILIFRRSTVVWILLSSLFMLIYHYRRISLISILFLLALIPFLSYSFGVYGNYRSNLSKSFVIDDLGASESFKKSGMSHNQYISYLYVSSPLANLQTNINESKGFFNNRNLHSFIFYCVIPQSITLRAQKKLNLTAPSPSLISSELLVGTFLMVGFITMGWGGMILMLLLALIAICLCLYVTKRWNVFQVTTLCILESTVCLLIFSNFLNRLDVILMVFIYPVFFHLIFEKARIRESLVK